MRVGRSTLRSVRHGTPRNPIRPVRNARIIRTTARVWSRACIWDRRHGKGLLIGILDQQVRERYSRISVRS